ncbi:MAG TPA: IPT/TIG domain-containing protein, partial [Chloroflexota bacterium]|nr:IPT/TIG domain-containing protein [Chloroflexota bacterium]
GIMHFSRATGLTQGLLVGDWLKRVMVGLNLSPDVDQAVLSSRVYNQFAPSRPLGLARPNDLPDTTLAQAFRADTLSVAAQQMGTATLPPGVAETATSVAATATSITGTQVALQGTQAALATTAVAGTATVQAGVPTAIVQLTPAVSDIPVTNEGCLGDEQMWFIPRKPNIGVHVEIAVTSQRHHDVRFVRLAGPLDTGVPTERLGPLGFVWTWTVVPQVEAFHNWTFFADGLRPCITSGFNTSSPLGATPTPTITPQATNTPGATATATLIAAPTISDVIPRSGLSCGAIVTIRGTNFGSPPSNFGTSAILITSTNATFNMQLIGTGSNTTLRVPLPSSIANTSGSTIIVSNNGGDSQPFAVSFATPSCFPT